MLHHLGMDVLGCTRFSWNYVFYGSHIDYPVQLKTNKKYFLRLWNYQFPCRLNIRDNNCHRLPSKLTPLTPDNQGLKKCYFYEKVCVCTKWMIPFLLLWINSFSISCFFSICFISNFI